MLYPDGNKINADLNRSYLRTECGKCFGFCCVALYFSASEGFPVDKAAGKPCINLQSDFRCSVHKKLKKLGLKGCTAYDCFGAGQKVAQITYGGNDWRQIPDSAKEMYEVFLIMRQIHEMLWYLHDAFTMLTDSFMLSELKSMISDTERLTELSADSLIKLDIIAHRTVVNNLLSKTSESVRSKFRINQKTPSRRKRILGRGLDLIGADLRKNDLRGEDLRGAYLIAANLNKVDLSGADLIGADMRDADITGANLSRSIFLTQAQINSAKGDSSTKLPPSIARPEHWLK